MANQLEILDNTIKEYDKTEVIHNSLMAYDWILNNIKKREDWLNTETNYTIKWIGAEASTIRKGFGLPAISDINHTKVVVGHVDNAVPISGSLRFYRRDLMKHEGVSRMQTYITTLVKREIASMVRRMRQSIASSILNGYFSRATGAGNAAGVLPVSNVEVFVIGQKLLFRNAGGTVNEGYIWHIDLNTDTITVASDAALTTPLDLSYMAADDLVYLDGDVDLGTGALQNQYVNMKSAFLSAANGGDATLHGYTKADYPFLQATNVDGSSWTAGNVLSEIFKAYTLDIERKAMRTVGNKNMYPNNLIVGNTLYQAIAADVYDTVKANYTVGTETSKTAYPYNVIKVGSRAGVNLNIINVPEMDHNFAVFLAPKTVVLASNGKLKRLLTEGNNSQGFYVDRSTTDDYTYVYDMGFDAQVAYENPQANGIIYGLNI